MSSCMFLREGATLRDVRLRQTGCFFARDIGWQLSPVPSDKGPQRSEDGTQAPLRRSRWFKCLHMQAGAIGPTMTCEMQLAGMAPSRSLLPGGAMADSQLGVGRGSMPLGSRTGEAEQFLAPTSRLLYHTTIIAGMGNLDKLCVCL